MDRRPRRASAAIITLLAALSTSLLATSPASAGPMASAPAPARPSTGQSARTRPRDTDGNQPAPSTGFGWPLDPVPTVSRPFQPPSRPYGPGHRGADLLASAGQQVLASGDGIVWFAGALADRGVLSIRHPNGLRTTYEPVVATVHPGQLVHRGQPIGTLQPGHAGCPAAACLHWGLLRQRSYLDPLQLVRPRHVRLLPWPPDTE